MRVFLGPHNIISPLGVTSAENFKAVREGKTAVQKSKFGFSEEIFCCAAISDPLLQEQFGALRAEGHYSRFEKMCLLSIQDVVARAGINLSDEDTLLILSTTKGNIDLLENTENGIPPERAYLPELVKAVAHFFKCRTRPLLVSNACISGLLAIIIAQRMIDSGHYKNIVVCGGDLVSQFTLSGFKALGALSTEPCKPFDANRQGINLGEAAASILISQNPVSNVIITAGASANDANHISGPSRTGEGLYQAITQSVKAGQGALPDLISAHGTATEYNDEMESIALSRAGLNAVPVNSFKGYYGHTLGAAGVLESILSLQSLTQNILIKSAGFKNPGTSQAVNVITETVSKPLNRIMKMASGFGGCNAAALFEKL